MIPYNSKHDSLTDRELLVRMRDNSTNAFDTVYERYHRELYAYALKLLKSPDDASDIIQDTFIKLWENSDNIVSSTFPGPGFSSDMPLRNVIL